jgi:hypothetical protein
MAQGFTREQPIDTDPTLSANSNYLVPSQQAVRTYVNSRFSPSDNIGIYGLANGVPLGTGTALNVQGAAFSISGTVLNLLITGSGGGSLAVQQDGILITGTVTTLNFLGTPVSVSASGTVARIFITGSSSASTLFDGWNADSATWTRTSGTTFTISGDVTATYTKWTRVRWKDGGAYKYGIVLSSSYSAPNTTVTLVTNSDYTMAAATITDTYYSYVTSPLAFPPYFNYSPTPTNLTVGNGTLTARYFILPNGLTFVGIELVFGSTTSITGAGPTFSIPNTGITLGVAQLQGIARLSDASASTVYQGTVVIQSGTTSVGATVINVAGTYAVNTSITSTVPMTWTTSDAYSIYYSYFGT